MKSASNLHFYLMLIVLVNVAFVHITGAVSMAWLAPMYALTVAAPLLTPCLLYTSPSPRDRTRSRMPSSA